MLIAASLKEGVSGLIDCNTHQGDFAHGQKKSAIQVEVISAGGNKRQMMVGNMLEMLHMQKRFFWPIYLLVSKQSRIHHTTYRAV